MLLINYINKLIWLMLLMIFYQYSMAATYEKKCGDDVFQIKVLNGHDLYEMQYNLFIKINDHKSKLIYKTAIGVFFDIACMQNKNKQAILLFQEYCFGNACPEDIYGVFNVITKKMLIKPTDWPNGNYKQTQKIIGYKPPFLSNDNRAFCCNKSQYDSME